MKYFILAKLNNWILQWQYPFFNGKGIYIVNGNISIEKDFKSGLYLVLFCEGIVRTKIKL